MPYYLGKRSEGDWVLGHLYSCAQGPFRTRLAAQWFNRYGWGNPHVRTVADAEKLAREAARENPIVDQWLVEESLTSSERQEMHAFEAYERAVDVGVSRPVLLLETACLAEAEIIPA